MTYIISASSDWGSTDPPCPGAYRAPAEVESYVASKDSWPTNPIIWYLDWDQSIEALVEVLGEMVIVHKIHDPKLPRELEIYDGWRE